MAYEDLLKDVSESFEDGNYFIVTISDLDVNRTYPLQFRWAYKDGTFGKTWSAKRNITTPGEDVPNTPGFDDDDVDVSQPEKIIIRYRGVSDEGTAINPEEIDRVDIYINGAPFDGSKPTDSFKEAGTKIIPAPAGTYIIALYAVSKLGAKSPVSAPVTKTVLVAGEPVDPPTNPNGFSSRRILAGVEVSWAGTYANGTFSGFEAIKIFAGTSASAIPGTYTEVGVLTGNNVKNTIVVPVDDVYVKYGQAVYIHAAAVNRNGTVGTIQANVTNQTSGPGRATDADINDGAVVISKLASDVLTVGNLKAGDINATSFIRAGTSGSARVELASSTVGGVLPGLTVYASDGTQLLRAPLTGGLTINGGGTFTGDLSAGSGNSIFKADSNGIYLGNASYSSAPFSVSRSGVIKAESGTIGGWTLGTTFLQGNNLKLDNNQIVVGATSSSYLDISPSSITHRNANGTASGIFTLTLGSSPQLSMSGTISLNASSTIAGTAASTVTSGAAAGASALQPNGTLTGNVSGTVGGVAVGTVTSGAASGASAVQPGNGVTVNSTTKVINEILMNSGGISISTASSGTRMQLNNSGLQLFNGTTRTVFLDGATGNATFTGTITGSSITGSSLTVSGTTVTTSINGTTGILSINDGAVGGLFGGGISISNASAGSTIGSTGLSWTQGGNTGSVYMQSGTVHLKAGSAQGVTITADDGLNRSAYPVIVNGHVSILNSLLANGSATFGSVGSQFEFLSSTGNVRVAQTYNNVVSLSPRTMSVNSNGLYGYVSSTIRHKKNINDYIVDEDALMGLNIKSFSYKNDETNSTHYGFIAEDAVELGLEELVQMDNEGLPEYFDYSRLSVFLFQVIKTQRNKISELEQRLDALEG